MRIKPWLLGPGLPGSAGGLLRGRSRARLRTYDLRPAPAAVRLVETRPGYVWVDGYWYWNRYDGRGAPGYYAVDARATSMCRVGYLNRLTAPATGTRGVRLSCGPPAATTAGTTPRVGR